MVEEQIIEGVATMVNANNGEERTALAVEVEAAMVAAINFAHSKGVTEPEKVRELMLAARDRVLSGNLTG